MTEKEQVVLAAYLDLDDSIWSVAAIDQQKTVTPLVQSQSGDLKSWVTGNPDERTSFLRHRIAGVLQRGTDRLWGNRQKARLFCILFPTMTEHTDGDIIQSVAQHFCTWLLKPPVVCLQYSDGRQLVELASNSEEPHADELTTAFAELQTLAANAAGWELAPPAKNN